MIRILAVGKKHETWVEDGIRRYERRLKKPWNITWELIPHSSLDGDRARHEESERLLTRFRPDEYIVLLDEVGTSLDSPGLSQRIESAMTSGKSVVIVIGGAYGVSDVMHQRADLVWSLSPLVFPHQLVRLILAEQMYRAQQIARSSAYHHA